MPKPSKAHMGAANHLLHYLTGSVNISITYRGGGFKSAAYSDANRGNNPDKSNTLLVYSYMLSNDPINFKVGLQSLIAQSTVEKEPVAAALTMKKVVFCSDMMVELGFEKWVSSLPLYLDNTSTLHVTGNRNTPLGRNTRH